MAHAGERDHGRDDHAKEPGWLECLMAVHPERFPGARYRPAQQGRIHLVFLARRPRSSKAAGDQGSS